MDIIGFTSYLIGTLAYLFLSGLLFSGGHAKSQGIWLLIASLVTASWFGVLAVQARLNIFLTAFISTVEIIAILTWLQFLQKLLLASLNSNSALIKSLSTLKFVVLMLAALMLVYTLSQAGDESYSDYFWPSTPFIGHLVLAVVGLVLIEQYYKNTRIEKRPLIKYLCFALGGVFAYQFYLYSDALLFGMINITLWNARGVVLSMLVPVIILAAKRNSEWAPDIFVSRGVVFHSATLLVSGLYLLVMAAAGNYIRIYGGEWGPFLQILFLVSAFIVLLLLLFSGQIRARFRVFLNKNFFSYAFDYRGEWLKLIELFSDKSGDHPVEKRAIMALCRLVESSSGALWIKNEDGSFSWSEDYNQLEIPRKDINVDEPLAVFIEQHSWIINLKEMDFFPELYEGMRLPEWMESSKDIWLIVPLYHAETLFGLVFLNKSRAKIRWNWEVRDLLKTAGAQAAGYIALEQAAKKLAEAQQFEGFNRLSAFVIHDLKNLIAQLSLVVRNAEKHAENPAFMKDAIKTVDHAVDKMQRLMSQLKNTNAGIKNESIELNKSLKAVVELRSKQLPIPQYEQPNGNFYISASKDRLLSAFEHVIQNAQDAAGKHGHVRVSLKEDTLANLYIAIEDDGHGMDEEFIRHRLFKPFETTKGLTGMGIGAYESREYIRSIGGDLHVESQPDLGSVFRFVIPQQLWGKESLD